MPSETETPPEAAVTPEDRSHYVRQCYVQGRFFTVAGQNAVNDGHYDSDPEVQEIARRRIAEGDRKSRSAKRRLAQQSAATGGDGQCSFCDKAATTSVDDDSDAMPACASCYAAWQRDPGFRKIEATGGEGSGLPDYEAHAREKQAQALYFLEPIPSPAHQQWAPSYLDWDDLRDEQKRIYYRRGAVAAERMEALTNPAGEGGVRARALEEAARVADPALSGLEPKAGHAEGCGAHDDYRCDCAAGSEVRWHSIESAPKDGSDILAWVVHPNAKYSDTTVSKSDWQGPVVARWIDHNKGGWTWHGMLGHFTHWLPLPPAPDSALSANGGEAG